MPEYSNAMFAHAWSIADNVSNDVPSMPPVNLSSIHWKKVPQKNLGRFANNNGRPNMLRVPGKLPRLMKHLWVDGSLQDPFADQINVDSTHPVLVRKVFGEDEMLSVEKHDINLFPPWLRERPNRSVEPDTSLYYHALPISSP